MAPARPLAAVIEDRGTDDSRFEQPSARLDYETRIVDSPWDGRTLARATLDRAIQLAAVLRGSRARSVWEDTGSSRFSAAVAPDRAVVLAEEAYGVASLDDLSARDGTVIGVTKGAAYRARKRTGSRETSQVVPTFELVSPV